MNKDFDMALDVLNTVRLPGEQISHRQIASICGCSRTLVHQIEKRALRKIRTRIRKEMGLSFDEWFKFNSQTI